MQFEVVFLLLFGLAQAAPHEGLPLLNPGGIGGIFEGPGSETIIRGPDGSEITSEQKGGAVIQDDGLASQPIVVAEPDIAVPIASAAPIIASTGAPILASSYASTSTPLLTEEVYSTDYIDAPLAPETLGAPVVSVGAAPIEIIEQDPHVIETEIVEAPDVEPEQSSDLKGPSGRIITKGSASIVSGPASTTITEPRKIIIAPPTIAIGTPVIATATIPLREAPLVAPVIASTVAPLAAASLQVSSTLAPPLLSYSTGAAITDLGYSTTATPLVGVSTIGLDAGRIDLGSGGGRESIPVVEYSSSNGVVNSQNLALAGSIVSTEAPILSSTVSIDKFAPLYGPAVPAAYLTAPDAPASLASTIASTASPNIQRISRIEDSIAIDGRVDMGYPLNPKPFHQSYQLPQVLGMALSRFYRKTPVKNKEGVVIDDKIGELTQNEIASYDSSTSFLPPPDLSQAKYIAPALARNGIDGAQVNLAPVPLSQVTRLPDGAYRPGIDRGYI